MTWAVLGFALAVAGRAAAGAPPVAFVSDLEGSAARLDAFLAGHELFEAGRDGRRTLRPGAMLVHGGDVPDRFPGGTAVVEELLRLKAAAPDRVVLIAGNRDINKLRLPLELSRLPAGERADRLKWILQRTMGAPKAFELRRAEIAGASARAAADVAEQEVADAFLADLAPGGRFRRLLEASRLVHRVGNTLFMHSGVTDETVGFVPGEPERAATVDRWIERLDRWYRRQLEDWSSGASKWDGQAPRPADALIRYAEPCAGRTDNPASVVYSRNKDHEGKIALPGAAAIAWLRAGGIARLAVGHTPSGEIPVILRTPDDGFEVLEIDNSHAREERLASLVTIEGGDQRAVRVRSVATVGGERVPVDFRAELGVATPLGKRRPDGAIVVAPLASGWLTFSVKPGWVVVYSRIDSP